MITSKYVSATNKGLNNNRNKIERTQIKENMIYCLTGNKMWPLIKHKAGDIDTIEKVIMLIVLLVCVIQMTE